jgi:hypothetical protein
MEASVQQKWFLIALLVGVVYVVIGLGFGQIASQAASMQTRVTWNRLAFLTSAIAFALHICYEHFRLKSSILRTAWHTAMAVALGGFGLALAANIHELGSASAFRPRLLIALIAWPALTGVPAFIVAVIAVAGLKLISRWTDRAS